MKCPECDRLKGLLLESFVYADRAQTATRCYLFTHLASSGVSDLDEYLALREEEQKTSLERHQAYLAVVEHARNTHGTSAAAPVAPAVAGVK